jgi:hypothetical protein
MAIPPAYPNCALKEKNMSKETRRFERSTMAAAMTVGLIAFGAGGSEAFAELPPAKQQDGVSYVTGGIGSDESQSLREAMPQYPLALIFASPTGPAGAAYLADVQVTITSAAGKTVLDAKSDGPYLLVKLTPGKYKVSATAGGKTQTQDVDVPANGGVQKRFDWK